jgi:hypothetical protein
MTGQFHGPQLPRSRLLQAFFGAQSVASSCDVQGAVVWVSDGDARWVVAGQLDFIINGAIVWAVPDHLPIARLSLPQATLGVHGRAIWASLVLLCHGIEELFAGELPAAGIPELVNFAGWRVAKVHDVASRVEGNGVGAAEAIVHDLLEHQMLGQPPAARDV